MQFRAGSGTLRAEVAAPGEAVDGPAGGCHRIETVGPDELVFIEVQQGVYSGEDDFWRVTI